MRVPVHERRFFPLSVGAWAAWTFIISLLGFLVFRLSGYGWDFKLYRIRAVEFMQSGVNPYTASGWPYVYPPLTLYLFWPFTKLSVHAALAVWMALKLGAIGALLRLWHKRFFPLDARRAFFLFFLTLAFNGALFYDLASGNIAGFQHVALWFAFAFLLNGQGLIFGLILALIAQVKMDLMFFVLALLVVNRVPRWRDFGYSLGFFFVLYGLNKVFFPEYFHTYQAVLHALATYNSGVNNPSSLAFLIDLFQSPRHWYRPVQIPDWSFFFYGLGVVSVLMVSARAYKSYRLQTKDDDPRVVIYFLCIIFGLINPRIPPYLYPLMILPTLFILEQGRMQRRWPLALFLIAMPRADSSFPSPIAVTFHVITVYWQWLGLVLIWWAYCRYLRTPNNALA